MEKLRPVHLINSIVLQKYVQSVWVGYQIKEKNVLASKTIQTETILDNGSFDTYWCCTIQKGNSGVVEDKSTVWLETQENTRSWRV